MTAVRAREQWQDLVPTLAIESGLYVDGEYRAARSGETLNSVNPANNDLIAAVACGAEGDVDDAVAAAKRTFADGDWRRLEPRERMHILLRWADLIEANTTELALLESLDAGKPISDVLSIDLPQVVLSLRFNAECIDKLTGSVTETPETALHFCKHEPLGVVGAIVPWNYPMLMAMWKVAPALAVGNSVVLKPAELTPLTAPRLAALFVEAGGPPGAFNVVNGLGSVAGRALALHSDVAKISFTGSTDTGKQILQYSGQSNMKRVALECGGKSPHVFFADLDDLERAVEAAAFGLFANCGQVCNAGSRILVQNGILKPFRDAFERYVREHIIMGDPLEPATTLGPAISRAHKKRVVDLVRQGREAGAVLAFGGGEVADPPQGNYLEPTLFTEVERNNCLWREEIFGPVGVLAGFDSVDDAIGLANDSRYGLAAGIWTSNLNTARRMIDATEAGVLWVNCFDEGDMTQPFGGYKQSGNTRDKGVDGLLQYTQSKSAWIHFGESRGDAA